MKKILYIIALLCLFSIKPLLSSAQGNLDSQLRVLLLTLNPPPAGHRAPFIWDLAVHTSDSAFYTPLSYDTNTTTNYWRLYFEMYNSQVIMGTIPKYDTLMNGADTVVNNSGGDTIPMGVFDFAYNRFRTNAFDSSSNGKWYTWTAATIMDNMMYQGIHGPGYDSAGGTFEYDIFAAAPLAPSSYFKNPTFTIGPQFIFYGSSYSANAPAVPPALFEIDFGDGSGYHSYDPTVNNSYDANYPDTGTFFIKVKVVQDGTIERFAISKFRVLHDFSAPNPDAYIEAAGLSVGVYYGCGNTSIKKPVIYLKGIDPLETRGIPEIYSEMIAQPELIMLKDEGYDFIIVDWKNSTIDLRTNAANVDSLLEYLTSIMPDSTQFVVVGESMGGVIGRYSLASMEQTSYTMYHPRSHNTRLFISIDAPEQGAFVPLGAQHLINGAFSAILDGPRNFIFDAFNVYRSLSILNNKLLNSTACKQLLLEHDYGYNATTHEYSTLSERSTLVSALNSVGYPQHCKKMALTNGMIDGGHQVGYSNLILTPHSEYLSFSASYSFYFLHLFKTSGLDINSFHMWANPDSNGNVLKDNITTHSFNLLGCLTNFFTFSHSAVCGLTSSTIVDSFYVKHVKPYDVMPGGYYQAVDLTGTPSVNSFTDIWVFNLKLFVDPFTGVINGHGGLGLFNWNTFSFSGSMQIAHFEFIPFMSAWDYTPGTAEPLDYNLYLTTDIDTMFSHTPYDLLVGQYNGAGYPQLEVDFADNSAHLYERYDEIDAIHHWTYLSREIGDHRMYLDNLNMNRPGLFKVKDTIIAGNAENPNYYYEGDPYAGSYLNAMYSRSNNFVVDSGGGNVQFKAGDEIVLAPGFEALNGCQFLAQIVSTSDCDATLSELEPTAPVVRIVPVDRTQSSLNTAMDVYPNPSGADFSVNFKVALQEQSIASVFDETGKLIYTSDVSGKNNFVLNSVNLGLRNGMYFIVVTSKDSRYTDKIIYNH